MRGLSNLVDYLLQDSRNMFFGISDIAYANTGFSYTTNMRQFLGWQSSVEMAPVNILIKSGLIGFVSYILIFKGFLKRLQTMHSNRSKHSQVFSHCIVDIRTDGDICCFHSLRCWTGNVLLD